MRSPERSRFRLAVFAAASLLLSCEVLADSSYHIGNSLTWDMYPEGMQLIAGNFGVSLTPGYHIRASKSLVYMLNNPSDATIDSPAIWSIALPSQSWNFVTFEPYPDPITPSTLQTDITAAQTFIGLVPKTSGPAPVFFIYEAWPDQNAFLGNYAAYWNQAIPNDLNQYTLLARQYFDALFQRLTAQYKDTATIRVIPVGDVLARINQLILSGQFTGASDITDFYRDTYHMGQAGRFTAAITVFATMYGRNPAGAPLTAYQQFNNEGNVALTPEVAAEIESIVWDVVTTNSARTGVYPISVSPISLTFQPTPVGASGQPQTVVLSNVTAAPVALDTISTTGNYPESSTCGTSLPANGQCTVTVNFEPVVAGAVSGTLTIHSAGVPYSVALSGSAPVNATISANVTMATVGQPITLTWSSSPGATCRAQSDAAGSPWSDSVASSGTVTFTESAAGSVAYSLRCSANGVSDTAVATSVAWSWPPVDVTLSAMPTTIGAGQPISIKWSSSGATSCNASGGGPGDGWSGTKSTTGTQAVSESVIPTSNPEGLTFTLNCSSSTSGLSKAASVTVMENALPKSGGGGAMDLVSLLAAGLLCCRRYYGARRPAPIIRSPATQAAVSARAIR